MNRVRNIKTAKKQLILLCALFSSCYGLPSPFDTNFFKKIAMNARYFLWDKDRKLSKLSSICDVKNELEKREKKALAQIKKVFKIPADIWDKCLDDMLCIIQEEEKHFHLINPLVSQKEIPAEIHQITRELLTIVNINPDSISLLPFNEQEAYLSTYTKACTLLNPKPLFIKFNLAEIKHVGPVKLFSIIAHAVASLKEFHPSKILVIALIIQTYTPRVDYQNNLEKILEHPDFIKYITIQELRAETCFSLLDENLARLFFEIRQIQYQYHTYQWRAKSNTYLSHAHRYDWARTILRCHKHDSIV